MKTTTQQHRSEPIDILLPHERRRSNAAIARIDAGYYDDPRILRMALAEAIELIAEDCRDDEVEREMELDRAEWDQRHCGDRFE